MLRPLHRAVCAGTCFALAAATTVLAASPDAEPAFRKHVEALVQSGELEYEEGLLVRFQRVFAPGDLPDHLRSTGAWPAKSATLLLQEYGSIRSGISARVAARIDGYLARSAGTAASVRETAHFRLTYETSGPHAVPGADVDPANGVPDFVDRIGQYAEQSRAVLSGAGFPMPSGPGGKYDISFREMEAFGYTVRDGAGTAMVLHRDYEGFPANQDPDGSARGAAKVATAHELKHASQFVASGWTEGGWLEADATWAEEFVFEDTNDYLRYLPHGSPVSHPDSWLANGQASYEDCLWQLLLEEAYGVDLLAEFSDRRSSHPSESVTTSFDHVLRARGSGLAPTARLLGLWSYFCGGNATGRPIGFEEAPLYPTPPLAQHLTDPLETVSGALPGLGSHYVFVSGANREGRPRVAFSADHDAPFALSAFALDRHGTRSVHEIRVSPSDLSPVEVPVRWEDLAFLVVGVTSLEPPGSSDGYFLSVDDDHAVGVGALGADARFSLEPNRPNPFRTSTEIGFSLPAEADVHLAIYDVSGRLVRQLLERERLPGGRHDRRWDGIDQGGRPAAPGVYYYRLQAGEESSTRRLLLLR